MSTLPNIDVLSDLTTIVVMTNAIQKGDYVPLVEGTLAKDKSPDDIAKITKFLKDAVGKINESSQRILNTLQ